MSPQLTELSRTSSAKTPFKENPLTISILTNRSCYVLRCSPNSVWSSSYCISRFCSSSGREQRKKLRTTYSINLRTTDMDRRCTVVSSKQSI